MSPPSSLSPPHNLPHRKAGTPGAGLAGEDLAVAQGSDIGDVVWALDSQVLGTSFLYLVRMLETVQKEVLSFAEHVRTARAVLVEQLPRGISCRPAKASTLETRMRRNGQRLGRTKSGG